MPVMSCANRPKLRSGAVDQSAIRDYLDTLYDPGVGHRIGLTPAEMACLLSWDFQIHRDVIVYDGHADADQTTHTGLNFR
jgi:hypothetical protein